MSQAMTHDRPHHAEPTVFVVDDDDGMRRGLEFLLRTAGLAVQAFDGAAAFLDGYDPSMPGCLLLDVRMPGMSGLDLQEHLRSNRIRIPVIIITAYADVALAVRAMHAGAFEFFEKPFDSQRLVRRVREAIDHARTAAIENREADQVHRRVARLTPREREIMELVVSGILNKEVAAMLKISLKTVENHRARIMEKMKADYLADLVRMGMIAGMV